jgi:pimeloyl-ACP methyl ester carboxylesterase
VLFLHGGPGLSYGYLDGLATEIGEGYRIASYQQRGHPPSTTEGPFEVAQEVADAAAVLDHLGWDSAIIVGHSWGGHLLFHLAVALPERMRAGLAVDPLGAVGDGGMALFEAEMLARTPEASRREAQALDERAMRGEGDPEDAFRAFSLMWPAYFPDPAKAPPVPNIAVCVEAYAGVFASLVPSLPALEAALPTITAPVGVVMGAMSPMPLEESGAATARAIPGAWMEVVEGAGHLPWIDRPGSVRSALDRLVAQLPST